MLLRIEMKRELISLIKFPVTFGVDLDLVAASKDNFCNADMKLNFQHRMLSFYPDLGGESWGEYLV